MSDLRDRGALAALAMRILMDPPPTLPIPSTTLVYCFAHHPTSVPAMVRALRRHGIHEVALLDSRRSLSGVEGVEAVARQYARAGVRAAGRVPYDAALPWIHTRVEAEHVVAHALRAGFAEVLAVTPGFHTLRAVMTLVSAVLDRRSRTVTRRPGDAKPQGANR